MMRSFLLLALSLILTRGMGQTIWSNYFNAAPDWVIEHDGVVSLDWQIGVGLENTGPLLMDPIQSSTAATGYAMLDSDGFDNQTTDEELAHMTTALPIDLAATANVGLTFQTNYRTSSAGRCFVVVSIDGTFAPITSTTDVSGLPNVFELFSNMPDGAYTTNPQLVQLNISAVAAGQPMVWLRFLWAGNHGYAWFIDDVKLIELPEADPQLQAAHISNSTFVQYVGSTPVSQTGPVMYVGGSVDNQGASDQSNVSINVNVQGPVPFVHDVLMSEIAYGESASLVEAYEIPTLSTGLYEATFTASSDQINSDVDLDNNIAVRHFSITENTYALDGIGVVPSGNLVLGSLGTATFPDCEDGMTLFSYMQVNEETEVIAMEVLLAPGSEAEGYVILAVYDTTEVFEFQGFSPLLSSDVIEITPEAIAAGRVEALMLSTVDPVVLSPGGYFLGVTLYSNGGANTIIIKDDQTYPQPALASLFYHPGDATVYSNGNALAVRAQLGGAPPCHAEYIATQATDGNGEPIPFVVNIVNTSTSLSSSYDWIWDFGDGSTSTEEFPSHDYVTNGPYNLCLTIFGALGCSDQYCDDISVDDSGLFTRAEGFTIHVIPAGTDFIPESNDEAHIRPWPNPVVDVLHFDQAPYSGSRDVVVTDALGAVVLQQRVKGGQIDVSELRPGSYALRVDERTRPFVKID